MLMNDIVATGLRWLWLPILIAAVGLGWWTEPWWQPRVQAWIALLQPAAGEAPGAGEAHGHDDHAHDDHGPLDSIELSPQARQNIGLVLGRVELRAYDRSISVPGMVVERPGRSSIEVVAPVTGIVTRIVPIQGQAVAPGELLFEVRLTHEEIVQSQADFLRTAEELDVLRREVQRLQAIVTEGAIPGRALLERQYEVQRQEAILHAQRQALLLHGLLAPQVDEIQRTRTLLSALKVVVPAVGEANQPPPRLHVHQLTAKRGQHVEAGQQLALLDDHSELYIEGQAFEQDMDDLHRALSEQTPIEALIEAQAAGRAKVEGLKILYIASEVDAVGRTFQFYVPLRNEILPLAAASGEQPFLNWRFKLGQRVTLQVPVERWNERIVLPVDAVAQDGPEAYVFTPNGKRFVRRPVHVEHRDPQWVVLANDGVLFPGDPVVLRGAAQLHLAIKNQGGGAVDPHAGHSH